MRSLKIDSYDVPANCVCTLAVKRSFEISEKQVCKLEAKKEVLLPDDTVALSVNLKLTNASKEGPNGVCFGFDTMLDQYSTHVSSANVPFVQESGSYNVVNYFHSFDVDSKLQELFDADIHNKGEQLRKGIGVEVAPIGRVNVSLTCTDKKTDASKLHEWTIKENKMCAMEEEELAIEEARPVRNVVEQFYAHPDRTPTFKATPVLHTAEWHVEGNTLTPKSEKAHYYGVSTACAFTQYIEQNINPLHEEACDVLLLGDDDLFSTDMVTDITLATLAELKNPDTTAIAPTVTNFIKFGVFRMFSDFKQSYESDVSLVKKAANQAQLKPTNTYFAENSDYIINMSDMLCAGADCETKTALAISKNVALRRAILHKYENPEFKAAMETTSEMAEARRVLTLLSVIGAPVHGLVCGLAGQFYTDEGSAPLSGHAYGIRCRLPDTATGEIADEQKLVIEAATALLKREVGEETASVILTKFEQLSDTKTDENNGFVQIAEYTSEVVKESNDGKYLNETELAESEKEVFWKSANNLTLACLKTSRSLKNDAIENSEQEVAYAAQHPIMAQLTQLLLKNKKPIMRHVDAQQISAIYKRIDTRAQMESKLSVAEELMVTKHFLRKLLLERAQ